MPEPSPALALVDATVAARGVRLSLEVAPGTVLGIVGPNGSGKSTLMQLVTGQLRPDAGAVRLQGVVVSGPGSHVPTHRRQVALLAQRPLLFPHLTVLANVAFGPRARGVRRAAADARARAELDAVGCGELANRLPAQLSGGQQQRVALARALAIDPDVVCLDEPLASLDVSVAPAIRQILAERLRGRTTLLVTHDLLDLWTLADNVAVLEAGRIAAIGPAHAMLTRPASPFVASLAGVNLLAGTAVGPDELEAGGVRIVGLAAEPLRPGEGALATIDPAAVGLYLDPPAGSPRNVWPATVTAVEGRGAVTRVVVETAPGSGLAGSRLAADVTSRSAAALGLVPGVRVSAVVKATQVVLYARTSPTGSAAPA